MKAPEPIAKSMSTPAGRIAAASAVVVALVGVVTAMVTTKPNPELWGALILLVLVSAVLAAMQQGGAQPQPAAAGMVVYNFFAVGPYGDAPFWARINYRLSERPYAASGQSSTSGPEPAPLADRARQCDELRETLRADGPAVIVVYGPPGAGKSALVSRALLEAGLSETAVRRHDLPGDRFDAKTLCEDIDPNRRSGTGLRPGEDADVLTRLEAAVEAPDDTLVPVVVDGAQYLLDPDTHAIISLELAEAIEVIASAEGSRRVKLILVFQEPPVAQARSRWLASTVDVPVGGLTREDFETYLRQLDAGGEFGLAELTPAERNGLYDALRGIPRLAELFRTVLDLSRGHWNAARLARRLPKNPAGEAERRLARELVGCLSDEQRRVIVGLAAYGTPVTSRQLIDLLDGELPPGQVPTLLGFRRSPHG